jgi:hypothetical protein
VPNARFCCNCGRNAEQTAVLLCFCGTPISAGAQFCCHCGCSTLYNTNSMEDPRASTSTNEWIEECISATNCTEQRSRTLCETLACFDPPSCDRSDTMVDESATSSQYIPEPGVEITTLMVCEIPPRQTVEKMVNLINAQGFDNTYDLIYMPRSKGSHQKCVFINFIRPEFATTFAEHFADFRFPSTKSERRSYTRPALYQGYQTQFEMHANRPKSGTLLTFTDNAYGGKPRDHRTDWSLVLKL